MANGFRVQRQMCATCIYRPESPLNVAKLEAAVANKYGSFDGHRVCHHSNDACCNGFWRRHRDSFQMGQIAQRLGMVVYVKDDTLGSKAIKPVADDSNVDE